MSAQLLQVATRGGGAIPFTDGAGVPAYFDQGIPYAADGSVASQAAGVVDHYHQGLAYTAEGRLIITFGAGVDHYSAGIPYTAAGLVSGI